MRRSRRYLWHGVAVAMVIAQVAVRIWVVAPGGFYWDDLILIGRADSHPVLSWDFLFADHDGHVMPLAFLVGGVTTKLAPLEWAPAATTSVLLQVLASLAIWRALVAIGGRSEPATRSEPASAPGPHPALLMAFAFYLFSPLTVPAYAWWAAALNTLPLQIAVGWVVADAIGLCRTESARRRRWIVARSTLVFVLALGFFEKSVVVLPIAFAVVCLWYRIAGIQRVIVKAWKGAAGLWISLIAVTVVWAVVYLAAVSDSAEGHDLSQTAGLVWRSINRGVAPGVVGGPWAWESWIPSPPFAMAAGGLIVAGWLVIVGGGVWAARARVGGVAIAVSAAVYTVAAAAPVLWQRSGSHTAPVLAQTWRYLPDTALVLALALALVAVAPARTARPESSRRMWPATVAVVATAAFVGSSVVSTVRFADTWHEQPAQRYLDNARKSLAANAETPMLDQPVSWRVLPPLAYPDNLLSRVFGPLPNLPEIGSWAEKLQYLDADGRVVPTTMSTARTAPPGAGTCSAPEVSGPTTVRLSGPLVVWNWVAAIPYCADRGGVVAVGAGGGEITEARVRPGLNQIYVQFTGGGSQLRIVPRTPGLRLHLGTVTVGEVAHPAITETGR